jgi:hypothetical protein
VLNGFIGTQQEWLDSLKGQDGEDGVDGKDAYQSYLDTTTDVSPLSESEWSASFSLVETFQALPEATTLESSDKLMINRLVGGVPTLYSIEVDILSDKTFIFTQNTPSAIWNIQHDLTKYPSVTVIDSALTAIEGQIEYVDMNNVRITFCSPFSGTASFN